MQIIATGLPKKKLVNNVGILCSPFISLKNDLVVGVIAGQTTLTTIIPQRKVVHAWRVLQLISTAPQLNQEDLLSLSSFLPPSNNNWKATDFIKDILKTGPDEEELVQIIERLLPTEPNWIELSQEVKAKTIPPLPIIEMKVKGSKRWKR